MSKHDPASSSPPVTYRISTMAPCVWNKNGGSPTRLGPRCVCWYSTASIILVCLAKVISVLTLGQFSCCPMVEQKSLLLHSRTSFAWATTGAICLRGNLQGQAVRPRCRVPKPFLLLHTTGSTANFYGPSYGQPSNVPADLQKTRLLHGRDPSVCSSI